eukprot:15461386-Alexandrium_andersonii.AAC.1
MATMNARSIMKPTMHRQLTDYMTANKIELMAIQETKSPQTTQYLSEEHLFVTFGNGEGQEDAGVGFIINKRLRRAIRYIDSEGSRVALVALATGPRDLLIVTAYAPHEGRKKDEKDAFYEDLACLMDRNDTKGVRVLVGDFNSRISSRTVEGIVGPWHLVALGVPNQDERDNVERLIEYCQERDLVLPASWKRRRQEEMVTFRAPGTQGLPGPVPDTSKFAELDIVITQRRWSSVINRVWADCRSPLNSDHNPVMATLQVKLADDRPQVGQVKRIDKPTEADKTKYAKDLD